MKEATGELNMTVITVVAIAAVAGIFYAFIWPSIENSIAANTVCSQGPETTVGTAGTEGYISCAALNASGQYVCSYYRDGESHTTTCSQK